MAFECLCLNVWAPKRPHFPVFATEGLKEWRYLFQWSGKRLDARLPSIKDETLEITILSFDRYPRFLVTNFKEDREFPEHVGQRLTPYMHETSDPCELKRLLQFSSNSHLIIDDILSVYSELHPLYASTQTYEMI
jgi:hypothetical protein